MPPRVKRTDGQRFFLTYAQSADIDIDDLANFLASTGDCWLEIVQENHQQEGIHYHVVIVYSARFRQPLDVWDFQGKHPNFAAIKNATTDLVNYRHYIRKGAERRKEDEHTVKSHRTQACDYVIDPDTRGTVPPYVAETGRLNWGGILEHATDKASFLALVRVNQPTEWVLRNDSIVKYADKYYAPPIPAKKVYLPESWNVPPELDAWCEEVFSEVSFIPARSHVPPLCVLILVID